MKFNIPKKWLASKAHLEEGKSIEAGRLNTEAVNINDRPTPEDDHGTEVQSWESLRDSLQMQRVATEHAIDELRKAQRQRDAAVEALEDMVKHHATVASTKEGVHRQQTAVQSARATLADIKGGKL